MKKTEKIIFSLDRLKAAATQFLSLINEYKVIAFSGDLGAGKTTFINAVCEELGVTERVSSPTYSIIQEYRAGDGKIIYHMDLYRIKSEDEAIDAGVDDCIYSKEICFVEWPEMVPDIFPANTVYCSFEILENDQRKLIVQLPDKNLFL
ncbi:MAG: tRNA (adenosine(37)-N6)-threonylcarbamoyltransferase complex ATPase subunit type 1 TsaE [Ginsengibacter sp.]